MKEKLINLIEATNSFKDVHSLTNKIIVESFQNRDKKKIVEVLNDYYFVKQKFLPDSISNTIYKLLGKQHHDLIFEFSKRFENHDKFIFFLNLAYHSIKFFNNKESLKIYVNAIQNLRLTEKILLQDLSLICFYFIFEQYDCIFNKLINKIYFNFSKVKSTSDIMKFNLKKEKLYLFYLVRKNKNLSLSNAKST